MYKFKDISIEFADIFVKFCLPNAIELPEELTAFRTNQTSDTDETYTIQLIEQPLQLTDCIARPYNGLEIYRTEEGIIRNYTPLTEADGCQVACYLRDNQKHILYYPTKKWDFYSQELHLLHLLGIEEVLLRYQALLLHSSVVKLGEYTILFSGPSGVGKSTQASLWENYLGARIVNGDRCLIKKKEDSFWGCGSPWCGTSGIYSKEKAPIRGIFILKQASENHVRRLEIEAFKALYSQCIANVWNTDYMEKFTALLSELLACVPVYELACRPDQAAVKLAYQTLFEGGSPHGREEKCPD